MTWSGTWKNDWVKHLPNICLLGFDSKVPFHVVVPSSCFFVVAIFVQTLSDIGVISTRLELRWTMRDAGSRCVLQAHHTKEEVASIYIYTVCIEVTIEDV